MRALTQRWEIFEAGSPLTALRPDETVTDVEGLIHGVIDRVATSNGLGHADLDELFGHLCERVLVLTPAYDRSRAVRAGRLVFRAWLFLELRRDAIDFLRSWFGRQGQKRVADTTVSRFDDDERDDPRSGRLAGAASQSEGDRAEDWADALGWLYARGDRATVREERRLGLDEGPGAALRDRGAAARPGRPVAGTAAGAREAACLDCVACGWRHYREPGPAGWGFPTACVACEAPLTVAA